MERKWLQARIWLVSIQQIAAENKLLRNILHHLFGNELVAFFI